MRWILKPRALDIANCSMLPLKIDRMVKLSIEETHDTTLQFMTV